MTAVTGAAGTYTPPLVWRAQPLRLLLVVVPGWITLAVLVFNTAWRLKLLIGGLLLLSIASPVHGLLALAALAPLGHFLDLFGSFGLPRLAEGLVLAFITGWLVRAPRDRPGPRADAVAGWLVVAMIGASVAAQAWHFKAELASTLDLLYHAYYLVGDRIGVIAGAHVIEGVVLVAATVMLVRRWPVLAVQLPVALVIPAVVAAIATLLLWRGIGPSAILARFGPVGYRVSAHVADANAAGSYFAMIVCVALGMALRARGRIRLSWLAACALCVVGLWFAASRTALAAAAIVIPLAAGWMLTARWPAALRVGALAALLVAAIALGAMRARLLETDPTYRGAGFRQQFNAASVRMLAARPLFGVGIGQYYPTSSLFLSPQLAWTYGFENAHNYFLQIGAELGVLGAGVFFLWLALPLARIAQALGRAPTDTRLLGIAAGVTALLGSSLTGHPLLVEDVGYSFWILLGLGAALAGSTLLDRRPTEEAAKARPPLPRAWAWAATAAAVCILVAVPVSAMRSRIDPPASSAVDGFYAWEAAADGGRIRWTTQFASLFVPADVTRIRIPMRLPATMLEIPSLGVEVTTGGAYVGRTIVGSGWTVAEVPLAPTAPPVAFKRVNLRIDRTWQPALYIPGSADLRAVGVQVGECELIRDH